MVFFFFLPFFFSHFKELAVMESMQLALENVVSTIFDGSNEVVGGSSEVQLALGKTFEGFYQIIFL